MKRFLLSPQAKADLADIRAYLKREAGPDVAKSTLDKIKEALAPLGRSPGAGHLREDLTKEPLKFWPVFSYLIIYDPGPRPIEILRVLHGIRNIASISLTGD